MELVHEDSSAPQHLSLLPQLFHEVVTPPAKDINLNNLMNAANLGNKGPATRMWNPNEAESE